MFGGCDGGVWREVIDGCLFQGVTGGLGRLVGTGDVVLDLGGVGGVC